jgi:hypothetical protein
VANVFYLASFVGRDMLWLRVLTCGGLLFGIVFFTHCQPLPMYGPLFWHVTFLGINLWQIRCLLRQREQLRLTREQEALYAEYAHLSDEHLADLVTRVYHSGTEALQSAADRRGVQLSSDEQALRDIAFSRLSRTELLNLLARRVWNSVKRLRPHVRRRPAPAERGTLPALRGS